MRGFYAMVAVILILAAHVAYAEDDAAIWITSPKDGSEVLGKYADVSVSFYGGDRIDLFVDGKYTAFKANLGGKHSYTFEDVELGDIGSHTITVKLYDCANAVNGQCNFLDQDSVDVTVRYIQLSGSKIVPVGSPASYTARVCYADKVAFYVNGEKVTDKSANDEGCTSVSFSYTPQVVGSYTIRADAVKCLIGGWFCNWDGPLDSDSLTLNVTEKYSVTIQEPRTGYVIHSSPFNVGVQYSGFDGCPNPAIAIYVDGIFKTMKDLTSGSGSVLFSISVPEGEHTIKAAGYCNYPNKEDGYAGHSVTIKADYLEDIRITSPASNTTTDKSSIDVDYSYDGLGFCSSPMAYIYVNDVLKDGKSLSCYSGTGSFTVGLEKGANDIEVVLRCQKTYGAKDLVEVSDSVTVNYEPPTPPPPSNEPPKIESVDIEPSTTVEWGTFVTVTVTASDPNGVDDLDDLVVKLVDGPCDKREHYGLYIEPFTGDTASVTLRTDWTKGWQQGTRIPPGDYNICITVYDDSGASDSTRRTLTITEPTPPSTGPVLEEFNVWQSGSYLYVYAKARAGSNGELKGVGVDVYRVYPDGTSAKEDWGYYLTATILYCNDGFTECEWTKRFLIDSDEYGRFYYKAVAEQEDGKKSDTVRYPESGSIVVRPTSDPSMWANCPGDLEIEPGSTVNKDAKLGFPAAWAENYLVKSVTADILVDGDKVDSESWSGSELKDFDRCTITINGRDYDNVPCKLLDLSSVTAPDSGSVTVTVEARAEYYGYGVTTGSCSFTVKAAPTVDEKPTVKWVAVDTVDEGLQKYRVRVSAEDSGKDAGICKVDYKIKDREGKVIASQTVTDSSCPTQWTDYPPKGAEFDICVPAGTYKAEVTVHDRSDQTATKSREFNVTSTCTPVPPNKPPVATVSAPGNVSPGKTFTFKVCGTDSDGRIVRVAGRVGSGTWQYKDPDSEDCATFTATAPAAPATITVYGKVKDDDGAWSDVVSKTVRVQYSAPTITEFNVPGRVFVGKEFNVSVSARDPDGDLARAGLNIYKDGVLEGHYTRYMSGSEGTAVFTLSAHSAGSYVVKVRVVDRRGLSAVQSKTFEAVIPPNKPPVVDSVEILTPVYVGKPFDMNVCAHDPDDNVQWISYVIEHGSMGSTRVWTDGCHVITVPSPGVDTPGEYEMNVWAVDYRNANSEIYTLTLHVVSPEHPPKIEAFDLPPDLQVGREYAVPIAVSDQDGDLSYVELNVYSADTGGLVARDEKIVSGYEANATLHFTVNKIGPYRIAIAVYDKAGHSDDRTIAIFADDKIPPSVEVRWTKDVNVPGVIYVDFKAYDNYELNVARVYYHRAGSNEWNFHEAYELSGTEYEVQAGIPVFEPGEYNVMIVVSDVAGNETTAYASARAVDEIAPVITITAPNEVNQGEEFRFSVYVTDNYRIGSVYVKVDGDTIYSNESVDSDYWSRTFTYAFTHASQHRIEVVAEDVFHNEVAKDHPVEVHTVDANAPVIELNAWYDENTNYILWKVRVTDPNLADVNVYLNGEHVGSCDVSNGVADCGGGHVVDKAGDYTVKVVAVDEFGNRSEKSVTISITDEPPVLNVSAPATVPVGGTATIHVSASDDFGLAHIELNGYGVGVDENISGRAFERDFNVVLSKEGEYAYRVAVTDTAGHRVEKNVTIVATTEGHVYDLVLTAYSGTTARVVVQGKIDGSLVDLYCSDVVVNIEPADSETPMGSYTTHDTIVDNHKACEVVVTGTGKYIVRATWMGVTKGTVVTVFSESVAAPENVWVALVLGLVALGVLGRLI